MPNKRWRYLGALFGALSLIGSACNDPQQTPGGPESQCTWTIATMGALSGDYATVGQPIADGVEFTVDEANDERDLACDLEFASEDSQGDSNQAPALAEKIISEETVVFCACPYFSGETLAAGQIFSDAGLAISGTGTNETIDEQGYTTWFRAVAPDNIQA